MSLTTITGGDWGSSELAMDEQNEQTSQSLQGEQKENEKIAEVPQMAENPESEDVVMEPASSTTSSPAAAAPTVEDDAGKTLPKNPCVVCSQDATANSPKFLNCLHTICFPCFPSESNAIDCPKCGIQTKKEELEDNFLITRDKFICPTCEESSIPVVRCVECNEELCLICQKSHKRVTVTRNHTLIELRDWSPESRVLSLGNCPKHPEEDVKTFCLNCNCWACETCQVVHHRNCGKYKLIDEKRAEIANECQNVGNNNRENIERVKKMQFKLQTVEDGIRSRKEAMLQRLAQKRNALQVILTSRIAKLEEEVKRAMDGSLDQVTGLQQQLAKTEQLLCESTRMTEAFLGKAEDTRMLIQFHSLLTRHLQHLHGVGVEEKKLVVDGLPDTPTVDLTFANTEERELERILGHLGAVGSTQLPPPSTTTSKGKTPLVALGRRTGPRAVDNGAAAQAESEGEDGEDECAVCGKEDGKDEDDLQPECARCKRGIHLACHIPRLLAYPDDDGQWMCRSCEKPAEMQKRVREPFKFHKMLCEQLLMKIFRIPKLRKSHPQLAQLKTKLDKFSEETPDRFLRDLDRVLLALGQIAGTQEAKGMVEIFRQTHYGKFNEAEPATKRRRT